MKFNKKSDKLKLASNNLIGNGAYKIKTYEDRNYMLLELNKDYYDLDKNNNKNDHSDIDIKRLAIANHFFIFTQKMPHLFSNSTFLFYHFQPRKTTF